MNNSSKGGMKFRSAGGGRRSCLVVPGAPSPPRKPTDAEKAAAMAIRKAQKKARKAGRKR